MNQGTHVSAGQELVQINIGGDTLRASLSPVHDWTLDTKSVAVGYGVTPENIRQHKLQRPDELLEGKHWFTVSNPNGGSSFVFWTRRGVVRLGFFIRSARAAQFRDLAEDLVTRAVAPVVEHAHQNDPLLMQLELVRQLRHDQLALEDRTAALEMAMEATSINSVEIAQVYKLGQTLARAIGGKYHVVWHEFKSEFKLASYRDLPRSKFLDGIAYLRDWYERVRTGDDRELLKERRV